MKFLQFSEPDIQWQDILASVRAMKSGWLTTGKRTIEFESAFQEYKGCGSVIAVNSCTAALHLAMLTLGIGPGDEVITTDMTFGATVASIIHSGATPVLVDCDSATKCIDYTKIETKITSKTRAILVVHFAGYPCNMDVITDICQRYNLLLIEDCAHAIETKWKDRHVGTFGQAACFSFYGTKNITTAIGEGGMLVFNDWNASSLSVDARERSLHGMSKDAVRRYACGEFHHYQIINDGWKYNMSDVAAAFAHSQLKRIEKNWAIRKEIWHKYRYELSDLPIKLPIDIQEPDGKHAYHLFQFETKNRDKIAKTITKEGVGIGVHYQAIHQHSWFWHKLNLNDSDYPVAEEIGKNTLSIPLTTKLTNTEINRIIKTTKRAIEFHL